jgi:trehalose 6-phosphate phosphatase
MSRSEWASRIRALGPPILIGLDVDGTLAPIVDDPGAARVPADVARAIERLAKRRGWHVALVTGRDDASLAPVAPIRGVWRVVEHGRQIVAPGKRARRSENAEEKTRLEPFERWARTELVPEGARLEVKRGARVVHVRELAKRDAGAARTIATRAARAAIDAGLAARRGRAVIEVELEPSDKGTAFRTLFTRLRARSAVYAGDDLTDRPAIAFAAKHGVGLFVRSPERPRRFREASAALAGPAEVGALLMDLARSK